MVASRIFLNRSLLQVVVSGDVLLGSLNGVSIEPMQQFINRFLESCAAEIIEHRGVAQQNLDQFIKLITGPQGLKVGL